MKTVKLLDEENTNYKAKVGKETKTKSVETENDSYNPKIIECKYLIWFSGY